MFFPLSQGDRERRRKRKREIRASVMRGEDRWSRREHSFWSFFLFF
jgi:hypothetical protein